MLNATTPRRILDTRPSKGGAGPIQPLGTLVVPVLGRGAVPLSGVAAVTGIITAIPTTGPNSGGYLTVYPSGYPLPTASNVNFSTAAVANQFTCPLGPDGAIKISDGFAVDINLAIDINGWIAEPELTVEPPLIGWDTTPPTDLYTVKAAQILRNACRYAMTTWWTSTAPGLLAASLDYTAVGSNNDALRRLAMQALGLSTAIATGTYDPVDTGVPTAAALARVVQIVDRVISQHMVNHLEGWGAGWQTPMWAALAARAAWFNWGAIPTVLRRQIALVVAFEADHAARTAVRYLRNAAGTILTPGDTGAEEVSWTAEALQVAVVMLPDHPNAPVWRTELCRYSLAAWARPADVSSLTVVNGRTLADWLDGSNVESDGSVDNHARKAPDYASCTYQNLGIVLLAALTGQPAPQAARELLGPVYNAYTGILYTNPPYLAPGGTVYHPTTGAIYWPGGCDWGTSQVLPFALADALALACGYGNATTAAYFLGLHLDAVLAQQARHPDGHTYANTTEYNYPGAEDHTSLLAGLLLQARYLTDHGVVAFTNLPY